MTPDLGSKSQWDTKWWRRFTRSAPCRGDYTKNPIYISITNGVEVPLTAEGTGDPNGNTGKETRTLIRGPSDDGHSAVFHRANAGSGISRTEHHNLSLRVRNLHSLLTSVAWPAGINALHGATTRLRCAFRKLRGGHPHASLNASLKRLRLWKPELAAISMMGSSVVTRSRCA